MFLDVPVVVLGRSIISFDFTTMFAGIVNYRELHVGPKHHELYIYIYIYIYIHMARARIIKNYRELLGINNIYNNYVLENVRKLLRKIQAIPRDTS